MESNIVVGNLVLTPLKSQDKLVGASSTRFLAQIFQATSTLTIETLNVSSIFDGFFLTLSFEVLQICIFFNYALKRKFLSFL